MWPTRPCLGRADAGSPRKLVRPLRALRLLVTMRDRDPRLPERTAARQARLARSRKFSCDEVVEEAYLRARAERSATLAAPTTRFEGELR